MENERRAVARNEVRLRIVFLAAAALLLAVGLWVPFGLLALEAVTLQTPFSALWLVICVVGGVTLLNAALRPTNSYGVLATSDTIGLGPGHGDEGEVCSDASDGADSCGGDGD